jgi:tetratricopeptide (TPR) repeat protein
MALREKIFNTFQIGKPAAKIAGADITGKAAGTDNIFTYQNPFDFYRKVEKSKTYIPVTQRGLRKAFSMGIAGIEFYIEMATSLRPLADEAQDIDEISRLLSQQKLTLNPNLHSVTILRNLIKDENPEIALYAAEGLNSIENSFIEKIQRVKEKIKEKNNYNKKNKKYFILYYILGLLYLEFAKLLQGQKLIQAFYLKEGLSALKIANHNKKNDKRILNTISDCYMLLGKNKHAIRIFTYLFSRDKSNRNSLMKLAECYFNIGDYQNVITLATLASKSAIELDEISNLIIYQWILNT